MCLKSTHFQCGLDLYVEHEYKAKTQSLLLYWCMRHDVPICVEIVCSIHNSKLYFQKIQLKIGTIGRNFSTENTFLQKKINGDANICRKNE